MKTNIEALATALQSYANCGAVGSPYFNAEWSARHRETIASILRNAPRGAGIDCGTKLDEQRTHADRIVFLVEYHRMDANGYYCGWRTYRVTIRPSFVLGISVDVSGRDNGDGTKDYLGDVYAQWASEEYNDAP